MVISTRKTTASSLLTAMLVIRNNGLANAANASVDHPLPWPLRLVTDTLSVEGDGRVTELPRKNRVLWEGKRWGSRSRAARQVTGRPGQWRHLVSTHRAAKDSLRRAGAPRATRGSPRRRCLPNPHRGRLHRNALWRGAHRPGGRSFHQGSLLWLRPVFSHL